MHGAVSIFTDSQTTLMALNNYYIKSEPQTCLTGLHVALTLLLSRCVGSKRMLGMKEMRRLMSVRNLVQPGFSSESVIHQKCHNLMLTTK